MFFSVDPKALVLVELVVRQEHPAKLSHKFDGTHQVVHLFIAEEVVKVYSSKAHSQQLLAIHQSFFVLTRQL